jgi:hypothetical protein
MIGRSSYARRVSVGTAWKLKLRSVVAVLGSAPLHTGASITGANSKNGEPLIRVAESITEFWLKALSLPHSGRKKHVPTSATSANQRCTDGLRLACSIRVATGVTCSLAARSWTNF